MTARAVDDLREETRAFVASSWSPDITVREWWRRLADARLTAPSWPEPYGRGVTEAAARVVTEELAAAGVVGPPLGGVGMRLAGPTILAHGTQQQHDVYLCSLLRGEESWCQLFSEPGAGSDLPSLAARAVRDGDSWVVNGQKVWNSLADVARRGLLLARTNVDVPKRHGITYFVIDMEQRGVQVRPLRTMNGEAPFCEVFLTDARVYETDIIGTLDHGWDIARTTLAHERASATERLARGLVTVASGARSGQLDRVVSEVIASRDRRKPRFVGSAIPARVMIDLARERGISEDRRLRQALARYYTMTEVHRLNAQRARAEARRGASPGAHGSLSKLALGEICSASRDLSLAIIGADAMLSGSDAPFDGELHSVGLSSPGVKIGAGTDEIQRNTIAERILGLPHEPSVDEGLAFRDLKIGTQATR